MAYLAFGVGPRNCIGKQYSVEFCIFFVCAHIFLYFHDKHLGMKFAQTELKIALVKLVKTFEFSGSANTPKRLEFIEGTVRAPIDGVRVLLKKRS